MVVAPPRAGKSSGFVVPWLLDHHGPALVLSTKRDIYDATAPYRRGLGRVWVYDPFGDRASAGFTPLVPARSWPGAIRAGEALASAAHPDQAQRRERVLGQGGREHVGAAAARGGARRARA